MEVLVRLENIDEKNKCADVVFPDGSRMFSWYFSNLSKLMEVPVAIDTGLPIKQEKDQSTIVNDLIKLKNNGIKISYDE